MTDALESLVQLPERLQLVDSLLVALGVRHVCDDIDRAFEALSEEKCLILRNDSRTLEKCMNTEQFFADGREDILSPEPCVLELVANCKDVLGDKFFEVFRSVWETLQVDIPKSLE